MIAEKPEQISLNLLKRLNERVLKLPYGSKFYIVYKTLINLFLNRQAFDETTFILHSTHEITRAKNEMKEELDFSVYEGYSKMGLSSEVNVVVHEFVKLGANFVVAEGYTEDTEKVDEIWLELRKMHDVLVDKYFDK